jgi:hypothetical protein
MKTHVRYAVFVLPALVLLALVGWWLFGALSARPLPDNLLPWLGELPIATCYAAASLVGAIVAMQATGMNLDNGERATLLTRALAGDRNAERMLWFEAACWFAMFGFAALYFVPAR